MNYRLKQRIKKAMLKLPTVKKKREKYIKYIRSCYNYKSEPPTILCSTCIGGMIASNLGLRYESPTVGLWLLPKDLLKFAENIDKYINAELEFEENSGYEFPVAKLADITIYFQHYKSEEEAREKWNRRKQRINKDNLYIITDDKGLSSEDKKQITNIGCKRIILFSVTEQTKEPFFRYACYEGCNEIGMYSVRGIDGFAPFEREFNYAKWLSGKKDFRESVQ